MSNKIKGYAAWRQDSFEAVGGRWGKTKSGIIIPETVSKEKPEQGKVIAAGLGRAADSSVRNSHERQKGDTVLFAKYAPAEVKIDGEEYFIISGGQVFWRLLNK